jgi:hypothetical protein
LKAADLVDNSFVERLRGYAATKHNCTFHHEGHEEHEVSKSEIQSSKFETNERLKSKLGIPKSETRLFGIL